VYLSGIDALYSLSRLSAACLVSFSSCLHAFAFVSSSRSMSVRQGFSVDQSRDRAGRTRLLSVIGGRKTRRRSRCYQRSRLSCCNRAPAERTNGWMDRRTDGWAPASLTAGSKHRPTVSAVDSLTLLAGYIRPSVRKLRRRLNRLP